MEDSTQTPNRVSKKDKILNPAILGSIYAVWFVTIATVVSEVSKPFKGFLVDLFYHHWIGKGILAAVLLLLVFLCEFKFSKKEGDVVKRINLLMGSVILGILVILGFFTLHYLG